MSHPVCVCQKPPDGILGWDRSMVNPDCPEHGHEAALPVVGSTIVEQTSAHVALAGIEKMKAGAAEALAAGALDEEETQALEEATRTITDLFERLDSERKRWGA